MTRLKGVLALLGAFIIGMLCAFAVSNTYVKETPIEQNQLKEEPLFVVSPQPQEQLSPYNWIVEDQIHVYPDKVQIDLKDAVWATFADTNSMDPVIDYGTHAIQIIPEKETDIHNGDIISYHSKYVQGIVIHRVVETGIDNYGWYATAKGDNNPTNDPEKIRFDQIDRVLVAIIY